MYGKINSKRISWLWISRHIALITHDAWSPLFLMCFFFLCYIILCFLEIRPGIFGGLIFGPRIFLGFKFTPIRLSPYNTPTTTPPPPPPLGQKPHFQTLHGSGYKVHEPGGGGSLSIMACMGRLRPKGVPFSGFRHWWKGREICHFGCKRTQEYGSCLES